jgi:hypothetical protein
MRKRWVFLACCSVLCGCGGGGSGGTINLFQGTWTGPWSAGNDTGQATFHITGVGTVAGTIVDNTTNQTYQVSGQILTPSLNSTVIDLTESNGGNTVTFSGTIVEKGNFSSFAGTLTQVTAAGTTQTISLTYTGS